MIFFKLFKKLYGDQRRCISIYFVNNTIDVLLTDIAECETVQFCVINYKKYIKRLC